MAKYSNVVEYKLKTSLDDAGFVKLMTSIDKVKAKLDTMSPSNVLTAYQSSIANLKSSLESAFNTNLGMFDAKTFMENLSKSRDAAKNMGAALEAAGAQGRIAFSDLVTRVTSLDTSIAATSTRAEKLFNTFENTVRWGLTASLFQNATNEISRAVSYVEELDKSLNDIRIVSGYSADYMREFAEQANEAAASLGQTTTAYTDAALIYIQQGKSMAESNKLAELTLKAANVTGQETAEVSEQLTSLMNGYQISVDDMSASVDILAKVAAIGAADMEELATAESKVASTASTLGVSQEQLAAQLSTIISVTRQAPGHTRALGWQQPMRNTLNCWNTLRAA